MKAIKGVNFNVNLDQRTLISLFSGKTLYTITEGEERILTKIRLKKENPDITIREKFYDPYLEKKIFIQLAIPFDNPNNYLNLKELKIPDEREKTIFIYEIEIYEDYLMSKLKSNPRGWLIQEDGKKLNCSSFGQFGLSFIKQPKSKYH